MIKNTTLLPSLWLLLLSSAFYSNSRYYYAKAATTQIHERKKKKQLRGLTQTPNKNRSLQPVDICLPNTPPTQPPEPDNGKKKNGKGNDDDDEEQTPGLPLLGTALQNQGYSLLVQALEATGLFSALQNPSKRFTIFAPDDFALEGYANTNVEELRNILLYHVVEDCELPFASTLPTFTEEQFPIVFQSMFSLKPFEIVYGSTWKYSSGFSIQGYGNDARDLPEIVQTDLVAQNGRIHGLNKVLIPDDPPLAILANNEGYTILFELLQAADLYEALMDSSLSVTLLAPTNQAFENAFPAETLESLKLGNDQESLREILMYHVLNTKLTAEELTANANPTTYDVGTLLSEQQIVTIGLSADGSSQLTVQGNENPSPGNVVGISNLMAANGVMHGIDIVLTPGNTVAELFEFGNALGGGGDGLGEQEASYTIWQAAVEATGLVEDINDLSAAMTIFVPNDQAFVSFEGYEWLLNHVDVLTTILLYHIVPGEKLMSNAITGQQSVATSLSGASLKLFQGTAGQVLVEGEGNSADVEVLTANVEASNGVVHTVDGVLLPLLSIPPRMGVTGQFSMLYAALEFTDLLSTLNDDGVNKYTIFAPNDDAFTLAKFLNFSDLTRLGEAAVANILKAHVVDPAAFSSALFSVDTIKKYSRAQAMELQTLLPGTSLKITSVHSNAEQALSENALNAPMRIYVEIGDSKAEVALEHADITAQNGLIHCITRLLSP